MKLIQFVFAMLVLMNVAGANVVISEIMYDPTQGSDTDLEWVEIYNNGSEAVDLSSWTFDGSNFDDITISPNEYIVMARELVDGTDNDTESFEAYYGNNDGVWDSNDGNFKAVDGTMSLLSGDYIVLTDGAYVDSVNYSALWGGNGNGKTIYKIDLNGANTQDNWAESVFDAGTPGKNKNNNAILVSVNIVNPPTNITSMSMTDDMPDAGYQIVPLPGLSRNIQVTVEINSYSSLAVYAELNNTRIRLNETSSNGQTKLFSGILVMQFYDSHGNYSINISATDQNQNTISNIMNFEYLALISSELDTMELDFGNLTPGTAAEKAVNVRNTGNVVLDLTAAGTDLKNGLDVVPVSNLEVRHSNLYIALATTPTNLDVNIAPSYGSSKQIYFRVNVPQNINPNTYFGAVSLNAVGG